MVKKSETKNETAPISEAAKTQREMDAVVRVWEDFRDRAAVGTVSFRIY
jgi:hypothetical protein